VWWIVTYLWENEFDKMKVVLVCVIVQSWWVFLFPILLSDLIMQAKRATGVVKDNSPIFGCVSLHLPILWTHQPVCTRRCNW
jgi:hypothetical protein